MFAFVERFRYFPGENRVNRAHDNQHDRIGEGDHVASVDITVANE